MGRVTCFWLPHHTLSVKDFLYQAAKLSGWNERCVCMCLVWGRPVFLSVHLAVFSPPRPFHLCVWQREEWNLGGKFAQRSCFLNINFHVLCLQNGAGSIDEPANSGLLLKIWYCSVIVVKLMSIIQFQLAYSFMDGRINFGLVAGFRFNSKYWLKKTLRDTINSLHDKSSKMTTFTALIPSVQYSCAIHSRL